MISKLDSGHRGDVLSVAEWLVLAAALDVPPILLLYPNIPDGWVEILPDVERPSSWAASWVSGDLTELETWTVLPDGVGMDADARQIMELAREREWLASQIEQSKDLLGTGVDADAVANLTDQIGRFTKRIRAVNDQLRALGATVSESGDDA